MSRYTRRSLVILNSMVLLGAVFAPWLYSPSDVLPARGSIYTGWTLIGNYGAGSLFAIAEGNYSILVLAVIPIGAICAVGYALLSGSAALTRGHVRLHLVGRSLLAGSTLVFLIAPVSMLAKQIWPPLWGYWVAAAAVLSSVVLAATSPKA